MSIFFRSSFLLVIIIILASILRLFALSSVPNSLNIDETSIGYNSYSLLLTGKDEFGATFPLTYKSFGDWKLIAYPVVSMLPIQLFGLSEIAVRLPSALSGITQVLLIYFIASILFRKKTLALLTSFFYAISPWGIYFSRIALEANLATTIFLAGVLSFLIAYTEKKSELFLFAAFFLGLSVFTYHSYIIGAPLFVLGVILYYRRTITMNRLTVASIIIFLLSLSVIYSTVSGSSSSKFSNLSVFNDPNVIYNRSDTFKSDGAHDSSIVSRVLYNKYTASLYQVGQNYLLTFSPQLLFDTGGSKLMNNLGYFGLFYIFDAIFLFIGMATVFYHREKWLPLLLIWFIVSPIPDAITNDSPSQTRLLMLLPLFILIIAYGMYQTVLYVKTLPFSYVLIGFGCLLFAWDVLFFLDGYFVHMNYRRAIYQHYGYEQAVKIANRYPNDQVVMVKPDNFPYISFLFFNRYDPNKFRQEVKYYPETTNKQFILVEQFGRFHFVPQINFQSLQSHTIYFDDGQPTDEAIQHASASGTIRAPSGELVFWYFVR